MGKSCRPAGPSHASVLESGSIAAEIQDFSFGTPCEWLSRGLNFGDAIMNARDPYYLLTLSTLDTPPRTFPASAMQTSDGAKMFAVLELLRAALVRQGCQLP
jgi:hypothetical protein